MIYYTGIGSRRTPYHVLSSMHSIAARLARAGFVLRSGGAHGADKAFECAADRAMQGLDAGPYKQVFIPWAGFEGRQPDEPGVYLLTEAALAAAPHFHPAWGKLTRGAQALHARNLHQVLGPDLDSPSEFVICWTPGGRETGGTATAMRLARSRGVPVYNLASWSPSKVLDTVLGRR